MKLLSKIFSVLMFAAVLATSAFSATYPSTNPTYTPNARFPAFTIASGVAGSSLPLNGIGVASLFVTGTCTSLAATVQASNDGTNWITLNLYPYNATLAASAVTSISATGTWVMNVGGYNNVRVNNTAVSGAACVGTLAGTAEAFALPR